MYLSKSKYCSAVQCNKILWLDKYRSDMREELSNGSVLDNGTDVGIIAKDLFGEHIDIEFSEKLEDMINDTKNAMINDNVVITEASFSVNNNFCSVDILVKDKDYVEIYEVKSSTEIKDIYKEDISYQVYVLLEAGLKVRKACIVYINSFYERHGELDLNKLFNIEDVSDYAFSRLDFIKDKIKEINNYMDKNEEPIEEVNIHCVKPYDCPYFNYCTRNIDKNNVFKLRGMSNTKKFDLYTKGVISFKDLIKEDINNKYKQQIEFELFDKNDYIDKDKIEEFLNTLSYPLYFLDFETYQQSIPLFDGVRPYMQIPFQYSLHYIENENGKLEHKEFLAEADIDPRRSLAESLVKDIPNDVCVMAYNMMFEKMVIKNLANLYSDLSDHLMNIYNNMVDLMIPFKNRYYYTKSMEGSYSIKYVLPALFPNDKALDYHNLDQVHNGSEAMNIFASLGNYSKEEQEKIRYNLLRYCELDTYAMVKIWQKLLEIIK